MDSFKTIFVSALAGITAASAMFVYTQGAEGGVLKHADDALTAEIKAITDENKELQTKKDGYLASIEESTAVLSQNEEENKVLEDYRNQINETKSSLSELTKSLETAKAEKDALSKYSSNIDEVSNSSTGASKKLEAGTHICPNDIVEGRYRLSGTGSFRVVISASNNITESQNLKNLDSNSYTLNLPKDSKLITDGDVTITPVK